MKVSPVIPGVAAVNPNEGRSASAERIERAKAAAVGAVTDPQTTPVQPTIENKDKTIPTIKMKTQKSIYRNPVPMPAPETAPAADPVTDIVANTEQTPQAAEATPPQSPQFNAELAKAKRALQVKEAAMVAKEAEMTAAIGVIERLKANPLSVLQEHGVTYEQLTEQLLSQNQTHPGIDELKAELKSLKEGFDKKLESRDQLQEQQVLKQIRQDVDALVATGDDFEAVREAGYAPKVVQLIHEVFKKEGTMLGVEEAAKLIENELIEETLRFAKLNKVKSKLAPPPAPAPQQTQPAQTSGTPTKVMRTLTNRDGASAISLNRRERAIAAAEGRLQK